MARIGERPVTSPVVAKPAAADLTAKVGAVADNVAQGLDSVANMNDQFDVAKSVLGGAKTAARFGAQLTGNKVRAMAAAAGVVEGGLAKGLPSSKLVQAAAKLGPTVKAVLESPVGKMAEKGLKFAGVASTVYSGVTAFRDESFTTKGGKVAAAGAMVAVGAAYSIPVAGEVLLAAEVLSGGGVSGGVKGLVSLVESGVTGDKSGLNKWAADSRKGDNGWVIKKLANNATATRVASNFAGAVTHDIQMAKTAGKQLSEGAHAVAHAWGSLTSWVAH